MLDRKVESVAEWPGSDGRNGWGFWKPIAGRVALGEIVRVEWPEPKAGTGGVHVVFRRYGVTINTAVREEDGVRWLYIRKRPEG